MVCFAGKVSCCAFCFLMSVISRRSLQENNAAIGTLDELGNSLLKDYRKLFKYSSFLIINFHFLYILTTCGSGRGTYFHCIFYGRHVFWTMKYFRECAYLWISRYILHCQLIVNCFVAVDKSKEHLSEFTQSNILALWVRAE